MAVFIARSGSVRAKQGFFKNLYSRPWGMRINAWRIKRKVRNTSATVEVKPDGLYVNDQPLKHSSTIAKMMGGNTFFVEQGEKTGAICFAFQRAIKREGDRLPFVYYQPRYFDYREISDLNILKSINSLDPKWKGTPLFRIQSNGFGDSFEFNMIRMFSGILPACLVSVACAVGVTGGLLDMSLGKALAGTILTFLLGYKYLGKHMSPLFLENSKGEKAPFSLSRHSKYL
jgi:hypothetical protein